MRIVNPKDEVMNFPGVCAFTRDSEGPFLDTDTYLNAKDLDGVNPYAYIHVQKVVDMGRVVGMVPKEDVERLLERVEAQDAKVRELEKLVDAYQTMKDAEKVLVEA
jgi:hypothetical protein